jgi:CheY-like chemotaxis protein
MSDGSIFRFASAASPTNGITASAFHHAALDADASARLAAMDRAFTEDEQIEVEQIEVEHVEVERVQAEQIEDQQMKDDRSAVELSSADSVKFESPETESPNPESLNDASNSAAQPPLHQESNSEAQPESQTEDAILATLIAEAGAEQAESDSLQATSCASEIDSNDPLVILSQTIEDVPRRTVENAPQEAELVQLEFIQPAVTAESASEVTGIFAAAATASEVNPHQSLESGAAAEEIGLIETAMTETDLSADNEASAPAPLEVAPIFDASGELQSGVDDYTPPVPFEIHVPDALTAQDPAPVVAIENEFTENVTEKAADTQHLTESFDLDSICAPTEAEQIIEHAIAQEDAVAEMNAVAEEFVAEQIAAECAAPATEVVASGVPSSIANAAQTLKADPAEDRRRKRRALISSPIRVRGIHITTGGPDEITTTLDVSRYGILFHTVLDTYQRGMDVAVVFPYHKSATGVQAEQFGRVVRLHELPDGRQAVAIALGVGAGEHLVDSNGRQLASEPVQLSTSSAPQVKRPMVLAVDADGMLRDTIKMYLQNEGYEVIAVSTANDAREVLNMFMPAMIVAEIEGEGDVLPGFDLCAHVKSSPSLKHLPVVLTSRSAYPSDYSNAHSLGAVVCMAKPYKMERLGHIVRLLAPLPEHLQSTAAQRVPDPTRGFRSDCNVTQRNGNGSTALRNGAKKTNGNSTTKSRFKFPSFR